MAATTQSAERILQVAAETSFADRIDDKRKIEGAVQYVTVKVPLTTDNAQSDVIELIELPVGAILLPELSKVLVTDDATSGALTLDIGDSSDADRYADGVNCASAGTVDFTSVVSTTVPAGLHTRHEVTSTTRLVTLTLATFTATIEAGELIVVIAFKSL
jgi:hypothetical protein